MQCQEVVLERLELLLVTEGTINARIDGHRLQAFDLMGFSHRHTADRLLGVGVVPGPKIQDCPVRQAMLSNSTEVDILLYSSLLRIVYSRRALETSADLTFGAVVTATANSTVLVHEDPVAGMISSNRTVRIIRSEPILRPPGNRPNSIMFGLCGLGRRY